MNEIKRGLFKFVYQISPGHPPSPLDKVCLSNKIVARGITQKNLVNSVKNSQQSRRAFKSNTPLTMRDNIECMKTIFVSNT